MTIFELSYLQKALKEPMVSLVQWTVCDPEKLIIFQMFLVNVAKESMLSHFHPNYKTTGPDRENRHKILFRYEQEISSAPVHSRDLNVPKANCLRSRR